MADADNVLERIEADLTYTGARFERGIAVEIGRDGFIHGVGPAGKQLTRKVPGALLPGFVNVHSHAFQRGLRGCGETFPAGAGSFWTWREAMYSLVSTMTAPRLRELCAAAFREMRTAGITCVGEFHYIHHDRDDRETFAFDEIVLEAAREAGIRLVMLESFYRTGGVNQPLRGGQLRFRTDSLERFWSQVDHLEGKLDRGMQTIGVAPHSIRAASIDEIAAIAKEALRRGMPCHVHVEEQPLEIEECIAAYHKPPMALLNERVEISPAFTAIHCTHTAGADMEAFLSKGGNVCACPLTEGNLGDGINAARAIVRRGGRICLGTDSNHRLCMTEEMRWLEYAQRLATLNRGLLVDEEGDAARKLLEAATINGARSLGVKAGAIEAGRLADFVLIDLESPVVAGWAPQTLLAAVVFGSGNEAIKATCVGGVWRR